MFQSSTDHSSRPQPRWTASLATAASSPCRSRGHGKGASRKYPRDKAPAGRETSRTWKPERKADRVVAHFGQDRVGGGSWAEQVSPVIVGRRPRVLLQLFIDGQLADQVHQDLGIFGPGRPDRETGSARRAFSLLPSEVSHPRHRSWSQSLFQVVNEPEIDARAVGGKPFLVGEDTDVGASAPSPSRESAIRLDRLRKSFAESPEPQRAVPPVGSTCEGPRRSRPRPPG